MIIIFIFLLFFLLYTHLVNVYIKSVCFIFSFYFAGDKIITVDNSMVDIASVFWGHNSWLYYLGGLVIGLFVFWGLYYKMIYSRKLFFYERMGLIMNVIRSTQTPLTLIQYLLEDLISDRLPKSTSEKIERTLGYTHYVMNSYWSVDSIYKQKMVKEINICTYESELYTYIVSLTNQCRIYANARKVKLKINKTFGYVSCPMSDSITTAALQYLLIKVIDITSYGGSINLVVSCCDDNWNLLITNLPENEENNRYWSSITSWLVPTYGYGHLRMIKKIIHLSGGEITGNRRGRMVTFDVSIPIKRRCGTMKCLVAESENVLLESGKSGVPHVLLIMSDKELGDYYIKTLSVFSRISVLEEQEKVLPFIVQQPPDIIIIDENVGDILGDELCGKLKSEDRVFNIPVILLINSDDGYSLFSHLKCGADKLELRTASICKLMIDIQELMNNSSAIGKNVNGLLTDKTFTEFPHMVSKDSKDHQFMSKVHQFLEENLSIEGYTVEMLSVDMGMSRTGFYMKIRGITGKPPADYMFCYKMEKAKILLASRQYKITEIANLLGYCDSKYFGKRFKKNFHMSPTEYLKGLYGSELSNCVSDLSHSNYE